MLYNIYIYIYVAIMFTCLQWLHPKVDAVDSRKAGPFDSLPQPVCVRKSAWLVILLIP